MFVDNGGIFVCKTRYLQLPSGNKANSMNSMNSLATGFMSPRIASLMYPSRLASFFYSFHVIYCFLKILLKLLIILTGELLEKVKV